MKIKLPMKLFINANIIFPQKSYKLNDKVKKVKKVEKSNLHVMTKYLKWCSLCFSMLEIQEYTVGINPEGINIILGPHIL
jgi:G:T/U-mismatch repair DNA glycosylase